jgi:ABC-type branched-subunit amino acid transport system substrate-binding protein
MSRFKTVSALATIACLGLAACGSDSKTATTSAGTVANTSAAATTAAASTAVPVSTDAATATVAPATTGATATSGAPAVIYGIAPEDAASGTNQPGIQQVLKAATAWYNDHGGAHGHPIEFTFCNHQQDPNVLTQCAQSAVDDGAAAIVGIYSNLPTYHPVVEAAGLAVIDAFGINPPALTSPTTYLIAAGATGQAFGLAHGAQKLGYKNVALVQSEIPSTKPIGDAFLKSAGTLGIATSSVTVPPTVTDMAPIVAQVSGDAQAIFLLLPPPQVLAFLQGAAQAGLKLPLLGIPGLLQQAHIDQTGGASSPAEGALVTNLFASGDSPKYDDLRKIVDAYTGAKDKIDLNNVAVLGAWASFKVFLEVSDKIDGDITTASFKKAIDSSSGIDAGGLTTPMDFTKPFEVAAYARQFNFSIDFQTVKDGKFAASDLGSVDTKPDFIALAGG